MGTRISYRKNDGLGWITLSNPPENTLTHPSFFDPQEMKAFLHDPEVKAVVFQGEGKHFSCGAEQEGLEGQRKDMDTLGAEIDGGKKLMSMILYAEVPVLAMIRGSCLGAGLEIALACHIRVASENALLGFPETDLGLMPGFGGTVYSQDTVRRQALIDLFLTGRMVSAPEALSLGLVHRVVPTRELERSSVAFLEQLTARRSAALIRTVMEAIHNGRRLPLEEALRRETELFCKVARIHA